MENPCKLTGKQEKFAQAIADGLDQSDAYRLAFNVRPTTKPSSIWVEASKAMSNPNVQQRVNELRKKLENRTLWSREQSVNALKEAYDVAKEKNNSTGMTAAVKELNAMHGYNAPTQVELSGGISIQKIERVIVKP